MLACARIGAPHTVVFGGFSVGVAVAAGSSTAMRTFVITADGGYRRVPPSALKPAVDEALHDCPDVDHVLVVRRTGQDVEWNDGRDVWWHDVVDRQPRRTRPQPFDAEHPLFVMYTSGTTGQAQGHPAHDRRLPDPGLLHALGGLRPQAGHRHLLVRRRHRLGHRPQLHRLRPALQRRDVGDVRGHAGHPGRRTAGGRSSSATR